MKQRGYKTVIITNGHSEIQRGKIAATQAAATVSRHIIIGGDEVAAGRSEKPHPGVFLKACALVACQPHEARDGRFSPHAITHPQCIDQVRGAATVTCIHVRRAHNVLSRLCCLRWSQFDTQALHVGDSLASDIQGGINARLGGTVWVNPAGAPPPLGGPQPTFTVRCITELPGVLDRMAADRLHARFDAVAS